MSRNRNWFRWAFVGFVIVVTYLALTPAPPPRLTTGWDKLNHALAFATLAFFGDNGFITTHRRRLLGAIALIAHGASIEIAQHFVPSRSSEWGDLLADVVGVAIGLLLSAWADAFWRKLGRR